MQVTIKISGWVRRYTAGSSQLKIEINEGETVYNAICKAGIPKNEIGFVSIEDGEKSEIKKRVDENYLATEGCIISVFPYIIGG